MDAARWEQHNYGLLVSLVAFMGVASRIRTMRKFTKSVIQWAMPESKKLRYLTYLPRLRKWRADRTEAYPVFSDRNALYEFINNKELEGRAIDYLEFGVYQGESIVSWAKLNRRPDSRFYGFDTFTGLPEDWHKFSKTVKRGTFDAGGAIPQIADDRVSFYKGLFQQTLPQFLKDYRAERSLVIHSDSDLYSATLYVLTQINEILQSGSIIIFDEFTSLLQEFRALEDYCAAYMRDYRVVASTLDNVQVAIRML